MKKSVLLGIVAVVVVVAAAAAFLLGMQQAAPIGPAPEKKVIKVGALCDLTGPTSRHA
jgi:hypothetical protein